MAFRRVVTIVIASGLMAGFLQHASAASPRSRRRPRRRRHQADARAAPVRARAQGGAPQGGGFIAAPARRQGEGLGPFKTLLIRGVMVIDGTGAPP